MKTKHILPLALVAGLLLGSTVHAQIYVVNGPSDSVCEYTTAGVPVGSGTLVSSGLNYPAGIAVVQSVPEASTWELVVGGAGLLLVACRWRVRVKN